MGKDVIDVVFTNDCFGGGYDRNLYVDYVIVDGTTIQAEGGAAILDRGDGTASFDGQDVLMGQQAINWNGALRLVKGEGAFIGGYDGNGNLTSRVVNGAAYLLTYDAESHLVSVSGGVTASFVYDGDGNRVKGTVAGTTTTYISNYFEWSGSTSTMKRYYYAGSTRVAMRTGSSTINYLLGDHLGSTAITTDSSGANPAEIRYYPWGKDRYTSGTTPTTYKFTGQRQESSFGLYFYNSRWYDPTIGRFVQADTIVPQQQQGVQAWDRYAYANNNPIKYTDPNGHGTISGWSDDYLQKQDGNTCAVVSVAVVLSIVNGQKYTQSDIQPVFPSTYRGIGVIPNKQASGLTELLTGTGKVAVAIHGDRDMLMNKLNQNLPVIVTIALPWDKGVGHALVAIGCDSNTNEILFFDPARGKVFSESEIRSRYDAGRHFQSFDELWSSSNGILGNNDMVVIQQGIDLLNLTTPSADPNNSGGGGNGGNQKALCL